MIPSRELFYASGIYFGLQLSQRFVCLKVMQMDKYRTESILSSLSSFGGFGGAKHFRLAVRASDPYSREICPVMFQRKMRGAAP